MREAGLELCLFIKAESAGSGINGWTRILPPRAASLRDRHAGGTGWNLSELAGDNSWVLCEFGSEGIELSVREEAAAEGAQERGLWCQQDHLHETRAVARADLRGHQDSLAAGNWHRTGRK